MTTIVRRRKLGMSSARGIAEFSKTGIKWVRSDKHLPQDELYIRWGCTSNVPAKRILNTAAAIHEVNDKARFRIKLSKEKLAAPSMLLSQIEENSVEDMGLSFPVVVRPVRHAQGRRIYLCKNVDDLQHTYHKLRAEGYISNFFDKVAEYRVAVVQGRAVWVAQKTPGDAGALAWNVAKGGRFDNVRWDNWPLKAVKYALKAFDLTSLDFGGVDVMVDKAGNVSVLEINSAPSLTSPYRQECMAKAFDYIVNNNKERIPLVDKPGGYLKFIHPAINGNAKLV